MGTWWLSYTGKLDQQFLGIVIVDAPDLLTAINRAGVREYGEVQGMESSYATDDLTFSLEPWMGRVLDADEARALADRIETDGTS